MKNPEFHVMHKEISKNNGLKFYVYKFCFYFMLIIGLIIVYLLIQYREGAPQNFFGFSIMTVLTESMQSEIPKDSLVITRHVDPYTIEIGDDITYLQENHNTITHRVINIYENYANSGMRGFVTQGIENPRPDQDIVAAKNIVGKVIFHNKTIGEILIFIKYNFFIIIVLSVLVIGFIVSLRVFFNSKENPKISKQG